MDEQILRQRLSRAIWNADLRFGKNVIIEFNNEKHYYKKNDTIDVDFLITIINAKELWHLNKQ